MTYGQWPRQDGQQGKGPGPRDVGHLVPQQRRYGLAGPGPGQPQPRQAPPPQPGPREPGPRGFGSPISRPPYLLPRSPRRRKSWLARHKGPAALFAFVALVAVIAAASSGGPSTASRLAAGTRLAAAAPVAATVTYEVSGSAADVSYGAAGRTVSGTVPMRVTARLGGPGYYLVQARLAGGGSVTVEILVNGQVASQGSASGGGGVATAEISQGPLPGR